MVLESRIKELSLQQRQEEESRGAQEKAEKEARVIARREQYYRELPDALAIQRPLFEELRIIGLVGIIEELVYPDKLSPGHTPEESAGMMERMEEVAKSLPAVLPRKMVKEAWDSGWEQKWRGYVLYPEQLEDGSLDPDICIGIDDQTLTRDLSHEYRVRRLVEIRYTPDRKLTIKGKEVIFEGKVGVDNADTEMLVNILAKAFVDPRMTEPEYHGQ